MENSKSYERETTVFISYSRHDAWILEDIRLHLREEPVRLIVDSGEIEAGGDFVSFMEGAVGNSDHCLLLWSKAASESDWVQEEWHAAYVRCIRQKRSFLCVARLEQEPVPNVLASRIWVDLFPSPEQGLRRLAEIWRRDYRVSDETGRIVVAGRLQGETVKTHTPTPSDVEIYLISEFLEVSCPFYISPTVPVAFLTRELVQVLGLPSTLKLGNALINLEYFVEIGGKLIAPETSLSNLVLPEPPVVRLCVRICSPNTSAKFAGDEHAWSFRGSPKRGDSEMSPTDHKDAYKELVYRLTSIAVY